MCEQLGSTASERPRERAIAEARWISATHPDADDDGKHLSSEENKVQRLLVDEVELAVVLVPLLSIDVLRNFRFSPLADSESVWHNLSVIVSSEDKPSPLGAKNH